MACPQCGRETDDSRNRLVRDSCGHSKCRACLLNEDLRCARCHALRSAPAELLRQAFPASLTTRPAGKSYECDSCQATFRQRSKLVRHLTVHSGVRAYKCHVCTTAFSSGTALRRHLLLHSGLKPLACPHCPRRFRDSSNLNKHQAEHTNVRYACPECGKKYKMKWSLSVHARSHRKERPWVCRLCPSTFHTNKDRTRHELVHSVVKRFRCRSCETTFKRKDNLDRHFRNTHQDLAGESHSHPPGVEVSSGKESKLLYSDDSLVNVMDTSKNHQFEGTKSSSTLPENFSEIRIKGPIVTRSEILEANCGRRSVIFETGAVAKDLPEVKNKHNKESNCAHLSPITLGRVTFNEMIAESAPIAKTAKKILTKIDTSSQNNLSCLEKPTKKTINVSDVYKQMFSERMGTGQGGLPETPFKSHYVHKKVHYDLKKCTNQYETDPWNRNDAMFPVDSHKEVHYPLQTEEQLSKNYFSPESIELYKKILIPSYKSSTASPQAPEAEVHRPAGAHRDVHWRRRLANHSNCVG